VADEVGKLFVNVGAKIGDYQQQMQKVRTEGEETEGKVSRSLRGIGSVLAGLGKIAGVAILAAGIYELGDAFNSVQEKATLLAETNAIIESTGGVANVTSSHIADMADSLEKMSLADDKAIQKGENILLTFKNIQNQSGDNNDIFDQTTKVMLDMSQVMGQDVSTTALQVGKALNDPVGGVKALRRVGVQLSDQQQQQIKDFMAVGDVASAQKIILGELTSEFGGAAQAAQNSKPWELLKDNIDDAAEGIAGYLLPVLSESSQAVGDFIRSWQSQGAMATIKDTFGEGVAGAISSVGDAFGTIGDKVSAFINNPAVQAVFGSVWDNLKSAFEQFKQALSGLAPAFESIKPYLQLMATILGGVIVAGVWLFSTALMVVAGIINNIVVPVINIVAAYLGFMSQMFMSAAGTVIGAVGSIWGAVSSAFSAVVGFISSTASGAYNALAGAFSAMVGAVSDAVGGIIGAVSGLVGDITGYFADAGTWLYDAGARVVQGLVDGITSKISAVTDAIGSVVSEVRDHLPFSPAKKGPLSGQGNPFYSGLSIAKQLASGMMVGASGAVAPAAASMAQSVSTSYSISGMTVVANNPAQFYREMKRELEREVRLQG